MNKEIKDRLDKLENELKESKNEIHSLKSSVSLTIERGIRKLLSRFTRKQLLLGSVIALFSISIIGIAGTVTKTYTFSSGDVVSSSKINTNFDTLYTLVNGNLDDNNISGISGSKITSGTVAAARLDNLSGSKITSGTVAAARIDNLDGSKITSGTIAAARLDNLSASMITSGTLDASRIDNVSSTSINYEGIFLFSTYRFATFPTSPGSDQTNGNIGGRNGADAFCSNWSFRVPKNLSSCSNIRALISISDSDEVRDMISNYSVPHNKPVYNDLGNIIADNFTHLISGNNVYNQISGTAERFRDQQNHPVNANDEMYWTGTTEGGVLDTWNCNGFSSTSGHGAIHKNNKWGFGENPAQTQNCTNADNYLICLCY